VSILALPIAGGKLEIMLKNGGSPPAKLASIIGPDTAAPISEATRLGRQQVVRMQNRLVGLYDLHPIDDRDP
jgi:hypothetical protein